MTSASEDSSTARIRAFQTAEPYLPLDRRWAAVCRVAGRTVGAYGATRDAAVDNLQSKLSKEPAK